MTCKDPCRWEIIGNDNEGDDVAVEVVCPDCGDSAHLNGSRSFAKEGGERQ